MVSTDPTEEVKPSVASKSKEEKKEDKEGEEGRHMSAKIFGDFMESMTGLCDKIVKDLKMPPKGTDADPGTKGLAIKVELKIWRRRIRKQQRRGLP